jgi:hypothetical protein
LPVDAHHAAGSKVGADAALAGEAGAPEEFVQALVVHGGALRQGKVFFF